MHPSASRLACVALAILASACTGITVEPSRPPSTPSPFGPLAVVEGVTDMPEARLEGALSLEPGCAWIVTTSGRRYMPVWPLGTVRWDGELRYLHPDAVERTLADGSKLVVTGGGASLSEDGPAAFEHPFGGRWVQAPAAACQPEAIWFVGLVQD
jgi:hypothetical protein